MPRKDLTLADKIALLDKIISQPCNTSHRQLQKITGVPKSTIARVIDQQDTLREEWERQRGKFQKRKREGKDPVVEEALHQWFSVVTEQGMRVNGPMLKIKSEELARELGHTSFKATDGWLSRWKIRHEIKFKRIHNEKGSADTLSAEEWKSTRLPELLQKFGPDEIYNADETGLFYHATPDGSLSYKHEVLSDTKLAMDRITILCCCNMSGSDKRKLLIIGKQSKPQCFKGLRMESLPVLYYANKNAWMTSQIFREWLMSWDAELRQSARKILLLLNNCVAHPRLDCLKNIHMEFLPASSTSLMQPLGLGIIKNLKTGYRGLLVQYILDAIEKNLLTSSSKAEEISAKISVLQAVQFVADSWRRISCTTIQNCFSLCGFKNSDQEMPDIINNGNKINFELQLVKNWEEFLCVDYNLQCHNENEDCEDTIVEQGSAKYLNTAEDQESELDVTPDQDKVTNQEARKLIIKLRRYFMQNGNEGSPMSALDVCADFVHLQSLKTSQQTTRMKKELQMLMKNPPPGISCWTKDDSMTNLEACIKGNVDTPFEDGIFKLEINITPKYPFQPPAIKFLTPIYHPNIDSDGRICLDILKMPPKGAWRPCLNISSVLASIQLLMSEPNPDDPLVVEISNEYKFNKLIYLENAKKWTEKYAIPGEKDNKVTVNVSNKRKSSPLLGDSDELSNDLEENNSKKVKI